MPLISHLQPSTTSYHCITSLPLHCTTRYCVLLQEPLTIPAVSHILLPLHTPRYVYAMPHTTPHPSTPSLATHHYSATHLHTTPLNITTRYTHPHHSTPTHHFTHTLRYTPGDPNTHPHHSTPTLAILHDTAAYTHTTPFLHHSTPTLRYTPSHRYTHPHHSTPTPLNYYTPLHTITPLHTSTPLHSYTTPLLHMATPRQLSSRVGTKFDLTL